MNEWKEVYGRLALMNVHIFACFQYPHLSPLSLYRISTNSSVIALYKLMKVKNYFCACNVVFCKCTCTCMCVAVCGCHRRVD